MAKKSTKKLKVNPKIINALTVLGIGFLLILAQFKIGLIGSLLHTLLTVIFGQFYTVITVLALFIFCLYAFKLFPKNQILFSGIAVVVILDIIVLTASYHYNGLTGFSVITNYFMQIQTSTAGLIGVLIYAILSTFFDQVGTLILLAIISFAILAYTFRSNLKKAGVDTLYRVKNHAQDFINKQQQAKVQKALDKKVANKVKAKSNDNEVENDDNDISIMPFNQPKASPIINLDPIEEHEEVIEEQSTSDDQGSKECDCNETYTLPPASLLNANKSRASSANIEAAKKSATDLINILHTFGIGAEVEDIHVGPSVSKIEIKPQIGVKVSKIAGLANDIKMALAVTDLRIEAPIPGKNAVGVEIPNIEKTMVYMQDLIKTVPAKYQKSPLLFALGKDLLGDNVYGELNKMPHLLIAGSTGSGKSVCVNSIITSILMRQHPSDVRLLLIDPKKVEFTPFRDIPHLLAPIITDAKEASLALQCIVQMMDERYDLFASLNVRNIEGYHDYLKANPQAPHAKLPYIVVIVDELADLMLIAAKDVETSIMRITQLARAAGIHLIVATQRPSVNVITGVIKANIPSRIAFAVSSAIDSRTILDSAGAEKLLGYGDMLYAPTGNNYLTRVQGVYISDSEVEAICKVIKASAKPRYDQRFLALNAINATYSSAPSNNNGDNIYAEVVDFVKTNQRASASLIQRHFNVGFNRASNLMDMLEADGIISANQGTKPRKVLVGLEPE